MLTINGHSDDIVYAEVNGKTIDEFYVYDSARYLRFPDGTVVRCQFCPPSNPKGWDFHVERNPNAHTVIRKCDQPKNYNYCLEFPDWSPLPLAVMNNTPDGPDKQELTDLNENEGIFNAFREADFAKQLKIYKLLFE